jgi:hypothetical protein
VWGILTQFAKVQVACQCWLARSIWENNLGMRLSSKLLLPILAAFSLSACRSASGGALTESPGSEAVLSTAQAKAELTKQATFQTPPPTPVPPTPTPPLETPTPEPTPTPTVGRANVIADYNAYVREGPDETYNHIDFLLEGQLAYVVGRYENTVTGTWYLIERVDEGKNGWVWSGAVTFTGDAASLPELEPPPKE